MTNFTFTAGFNPTFAGANNVKDVFTLNNISDFSSAEAALGGSSSSFTNDDQFVFNTSGNFGVFNGAMDRVFGVENVSIKKGGLNFDIHTNWVETARNHTITVISQALSGSPITVSPFFWEDASFRLIYLGSASNVVDEVDGGPGADSLSGNEGNDIIHGSLGADIMSGGNGIDELNYGGSTSQVIVNLATGVVSGGFAQGDTISGFENLFGSTSRSDILVGSSGVNKISGNGGNDIIEGLAGGDILDGGNAGSDTVSYLQSNAGVTVTINGFVAGGHAAGDRLTNFENLTGSTHQDTLTGTADANTIDGNADNDTIRGLAGADTLKGGDGVDTISYAGSNAAVTINLTTNAASGGHATGDIISGFENITGSAFVDRLTGNAAANRIDGGDNSDTIEGGAGADRLIGGAGVNTLQYLGSSSGVLVNLQTQIAVFGDAQGDTISGFQNVVGSQRDDQLTGSTGINIIEGRGGNDRIEGGAGADSLIGGSELGDVLVYSSSNAGVTIDLLNNTASGGHADGDVLNGFESIVGSLHHDVLSGTNGANHFFLSEGGDDVLGRGGADTFDSGSGNDTFDGGEGSDTIRFTVTVGDGGVICNLATGTAASAASGTDALISVENVIGTLNNDILTGNNDLNTLDGGQRNDTIRGGLGADILTGGQGIDTLDYSDSSVGVSVSLITGVVSGGSAQGDTVALFENVIGSAGIDTISGDTLDNSLRGGGENDTLIGLGGVDTLDGGAGVDAMKGGNASDIYVVDVVGDTVAEAAGDVAGTADLVTFIGATGNFALTDNVERLKLAGISAIGGIGNELINVIAGNDAANLIAGGLGNDTLTGNGGTDTFRFDTVADNATNRDSVADFVAGQDKVELDNAVFLNLVGAEGTTVTANQFVSNTTGLAQDADDRIIYETDTGLLRFDSNGNAAGGAVIFAIMIGLPALTNADFVIG